MRRHRAVLVALALAVLAPVALHAQQAQVFRYVHRGVLGILTEGVPANTMDARQRIVMDVVPGSPAEKAGVLRGDTILRINGLAATAQVMSAPFEPGDTVVLRVKRSGTERDITVVAAERSGQFQAFIGDSIRGQMNIIMDRMRFSVDSVMPSISVRRLDGDSSVTIIVTGTDTTVVPGARGSMFIDRRMGPDSVFFRGIPGIEFSEIFGDSARISIYRNVDGNVFTYGDTSGIFRPAELMRAGTLLGMRAVAGAELSDLNPGLGEYFGTSSGVLVISARAGTPAERAGLRPGDVISQVNGAAVTNVMELRRAIDRASGSTVQLRLLRRGQNVDVTLGR